MSMNDPGEGVSVVIPTFNRAGKLLRAIASVQAQTHRVDEIIVVDDGSTDSTAEAVAALTDDRVRYVRQANAGANVARNNGVRHAHGRWISFLDSDDQYLPERVERQLAAIVRTGAQACFCSAIAIDAQGNERYRYYTPATISLEDICARNWLGSTSTAIVARTLLDAVGGFDETLRSCQDWDLYIRMRKVADLAIVSTPLILYEDDAGDRISNDLTKVIEGHRRVFDRARAAVRHDRAAMRRIQTEHQLTLAMLYRWRHRWRHEALHLAAAAAIGRRPDLLRQAGRAIVGGAKGRLRRDVG